MFGLGFQELLVIALVALIVVGPKRLPQVGQALGRALAEFRRASDEFRRGISEDESVRTIRQTGEELRGASRDLKSKIVPPAESLSRTKRAPATVDVAVEETPQAEDPPSEPKPRAEAEVDTGKA